MWRRKTPDEMATTALADRWRQTAEGAGVCREVVNGAGSTVVVIPPVVRVKVDPPIRLTVRLLPGMLPADLSDQSARLASGMGVAALRVTPADHGHVVVSLLLSDPLAATTGFPGRLRSALDPLQLGIGEDGTPIAVELGSSAHLILQGATGSGKSTAAYSILAQLADAPDVQVAGSDVSRVLLAPWVDRPGSGPIALGTTDPLHHVGVIEDLVAEMDKRIAAMPAGRDAVELGPDLPVLLVVLEELPGLYRWLDQVDTKLGKRVRAGIARLMAEGRKTGLRVVLIPQRADAAVIGAFERGQASHRMSFRVDSADGLKMLHPDIPLDVAANHSTAPAGVALISAPGRPLTRFRAPRVTYAEYCALVRP